jgi:hypothetical protein
MSVVSFSVYQFTGEVAAITAGVVGYPETKKLAAAAAGVSVAAAVTAAAVVVAASH